MKKNSRIERIIVIFGIVVAMVLAGILAHTLYIRRGQQSVLEDAEPVGDEESDSYDWDGSYMETMYLETTLNIEKRIDGLYDVTLTWGETDGDALTIWQCTASYDKAHRALVYNDAVRTDLVIPTGEDAAGATSKDIYAGGAGFFYLRGNKIYWEDKKEDFGDGLQFEKT